MWKGKRKRKERLKEGIGHSMGGGRRGMYHGCKKTRECVCMYVRVRVGGCDRQNTPHEPTPEKKGKIERKRPKKERTLL